MSDDLYARRIRFDGDRGCVKAPGFFRRVLNAPEIPGLPVLQRIDYVPEVHVYRLQELYEGERDMRDHELEACRVWLAEQVASAVERRG